MALQKTISILQDGITRGLHLGAQLYVSQNGKVVCDDAVGNARPGEPMTRDMLLLWMSAGKPVTALAVAQQIERKKLSLDTRVADLIPGFGANGKDAVLVRHLLNHTAGFRGPINSFTPGSWEEIIQRICNLRIEPGWVPGQKAGYHIASTWFILAELVRIVDSRPIEQYVREEIFLPLGQNDAWIGMPMARYEEYGRRIAPMFETTRSWPDDSVGYNQVASTVLPRPAANARGPIASLGAIYDCLLRGGSPILSAELTRQFTSPQRVGMVDETFKTTLDWGFGFMIDSKKYVPSTSSGQAGPHPYGYGAYASERTFGHSGNQCSCGFADPERNLVVAWDCNGLPGETAHQARQHAINSAIYEDLELV
jgi:CubicO group peptidase (beta-lactamase class C family)